MNNGVFKKKGIIIFAAAAVLICISLIIVDLVVRKNNSNINMPLDEEINEITEEKLITDVVDVTSVNTSDENEEIIGEETSEPEVVDYSLLLNASNVGENDQITYGIDVSKYQGTIDWSKVSESNISFAMIRVGYRNYATGEIIADPNALYNMQEAEKYGIKIGVYFASTAITEQEAKEEAEWVADYIAKFPITYPVGYDCEGYEKASGRQYNLTQEERSNLAMVFMDRIYDLGYTPIFYSSVNELKQDNKWNTSQIQRKYKIWLAWYNQETSNLENKPAYDGQFVMWQYTNKGFVDGIKSDVDLNVAYFGYNGTEKAKDDSNREEAFADEGALLNWTEVNETVTAKNETNLRNKPSQGEDSTIVYSLKNGETVLRTAVSPDGWSRVIYNGKTCYAVSNYLTTDLEAPAQIVADDNSGFKTQFTPCNEKVTAKELVNLRNKPSVTDEDSMVVATLSASEVAIRTGINTDVGWSRLEYNGQVLYCISSYIYVVE